MKGVSPYRRSRLGLGRTFQRLELFGTLTVRENVRVAASVGRRRNRWPVGAGHESVDELTDGLLRRVHLDEVAEARADTLPTGTGRLVELARALAIHPTTLLLDEPASGQNPEETSRFGAILRSLSADGLAILLVEHDMDLVMSVCDTVFVLVQGDGPVLGDPRRGPSATPPWRTPIWAAWWRRRVADAATPLLEARGHPVLLRERRGPPRRGPA